jgi:hypothetical protein
MMDTNCSQVFHTIDAVNAKGSEKSHKATILGTHTMFRV